MRSSLTRHAHFGLSYRTRATLLPPTKGHTYGQLLACTCKKILNMAKPFAQLGGQTYENLIPLEEGQLVGQWRDSNDGLGGGRYPYDVNTGLMPAALRAIAELARAGTFEDHDGWTDIADQYAEVWETETLAFFGVGPRLAIEPAFSSLDSA